MVRRVAMFKFKPEATQQQKEAVLKVMNQILRDVPRIKKFATGLRGDHAGTHEIGMVLEFETEEDLTAGYIQHPAHNALGGKLVESGVVDLTSAAYLDFAD